MKKYSKDYAKQWAKYRFTAPYRGNYENAYLQAVQECHVEELVEKIEWAISGLKGLGAPVSKDIIDELEKTLKKLETNGE